MYEGKPIIGLAGGIGSGKSFVSKLLAEGGCTVIRSDELVHEAYRDGRLKATLRKWWGDMIFSPNGDVDRAAIARKIFDRDAERRRLEGVLHPLVGEARQRLMHAAAADPAVKAFVWDTPLLFENNLNRVCDAVIFIDAPLELRLKRVAQRGWSEAELARRENSQMPLDNKRAMSNYVLDSAADVDTVRDQIRTILTRILAATEPSPSVKGV